MKRHLLVTNDFPPKDGGIQVYLWELWRRLDPSSFAVLTARSHPEWAQFDAEQSARGFRIERVDGALLYLPTRAVRRAVRESARRTGAGAVIFDPVLPLGLLGPSLGLPYGVVLHGAEVTVPGRLPGSRAALARVLRHAALVVSAGGYPADEGRRALGGPLPHEIEVPPGVDCRRFVPLSDDAKAAARRRLGLPPSGPLVVSVSRLVPRKGMDVLAEAGGRLQASFPGLTVAIGGAGRDAGRLRRSAAGGALPVHLLGRVDDRDLPDLVGAADVFAMACRSRWLGLEQEGFGIVFMEAAAAGVPQVAGDSGGAADAVEDGVTGLVVRRPGDPGAVALALRCLLSDEGRRRAMGEQARRRAVTSFDYSRLAPRLAVALAEMEG